MKKKTFLRSLSVLLVLCALLAQMAVPAGAAAYTPVNGEKAATLGMLGLLVGDRSGDFMLSSGLKRSDMAIMLVRLLGKAEEAASGGYTHPFADVIEKTAWAGDYVGYLFQNGLVAGKTAASFGAADPTTYLQFIAVTLRALGYTEAAGDFAYSDAPIKAVEVGLLNSAELAAVRNSSNLLRDNMVLIAYNALFTRMKDSNEVLLDTLDSVSDTALTLAAQSDKKVSSYLSGGSSAGMDASQISAVLSPAVCLIDVYGKNGSLIGSGSGFAVSATGTVVTCYHVIEGVYSAKATFPDGKSYSVASVLGYDADRDIAALKLLNAASLPTVTLGDSSTVASGEKAFTVSYPLGLSLSVSEGIVGSARYSYMDQSYIQFSAPVSPGSSGGALVNASGKVVGIVEGTLTEGQSLNLAVPINAYKTLPQTGGMTLAQVAEAEGATVIEPDWVEETEPNNVLSAAQTLAPDGGKMTIGSLNGSTDTDCYTFSTTGGEFVGMFMLDPGHETKLTGVQFRLHDNSGAVIAAAIVTYYEGSMLLLLYPSFPLTSGNYYLSLSCRALSFTDNVEYAFNFLTE